MEAVNVRTEEHTVCSYDKLVIAVGASALVPPVDGIGLKGVYVMRTPQDAITLRQAVEDGQVKRAVVAGGGFIGLEVAENLQAQGVKVSVIDMASHILPGFDPEIADYVENHLADEGLILYRNEAGGYFRHRAGGKGKDGQTGHEGGHGGNGAGNPAQHGISKGYGSCHAAKWYPSCE